MTYRTVANCLAALGATVAGVLYALWLRYTGPDTTLSFNIMIDILLMVVIGGMGTMYGAVLGATLFVIAQNYLQDLMKLASGAPPPACRCCRRLLHPDRWLLWLGVLFIVCVYYFPERHRRAPAPMSSRYAAQGVIGSCFSSSSTFGRTPMKRAKKMPAS